MNIIKNTKILIICSILIILTSCSGIKFDKKPDILEIRNIANLSTLDCYYHNVAKSIKEKGTGLVHWGEKDREFWIEYTGIVSLGIDISQVEMEMKDNDITITIPKAKVIGEPIVDPKSWNEDSIILDGDNFNKNEIGSEDITTAIGKAQKHMVESAERNVTLLNNAQMRAKTLIETYIKQLGEMTNTKYNVTWKLISQNDKVNVINENE